MPEQELLAALGRVPSGLFIVTARHGRQETGMLASWVQQCAFVPPSLTLAIKQGRYVGEWLKAGCPWSLNILGEEQTDLIGHFGRGFAPDQDAFAGLAVLRRPELPPILSECLAYLDCRVRHWQETGDHTLFIGEVVGGAVLQSGRPMIHVRRTAAHY
jgi:flavin reductase (DIM6/NTAB) family NADH-FMN oxidoreductase RutF